MCLLMLQDTDEPSATLQSVINEIDFDFDIETINVRERYMERCNGKIPCILEFIDRTVLEKTELIVIDSVLLNLHEKLLTDQLRDKINIPILVVTSVDSVITDFKLNPTTNTVALEKPYRYSKFKHFVETGLRKGFNERVKYDSAYGKHRYTDAFVQCLAGLEIKEK